MVRFGGAALIIDYGHPESAIGETLQAVGGHDFADPLRRRAWSISPRMWTFRRWRRRPKAWARACTGRCRKANCCAASASSSGRRRSRRAPRRTMPTTIDAALARLTDENRTGMGGLIKAIAVSDPKLDTLPGFDT